MSEKTLKALVVALLAVVVLWALASFLGGRSGGTDGSREALAGTLAGATPGSVSEVRITDPDRSVTLDRTSTGTWTVNGYRADSGAVARFWSAVEEARVGEVAATNPANHPRMGVASDSAITLELVVEGESRTLLVGKQGPSYGTAFVRLPEADAVHVLDGELRPSLTRPLEDWRNKRMAAVDTARVARIRVERDGSAYTLTRADTVWSLEDGGKAEAPPVRTLLGQLANLRASGFVEEADTLPARAIRVTAAAPAGDTLVALELGEGDGDRWARVAGDSILYRFPSWRVSQVAPEREDVEGGG